MNARRTARDVGTLVVAFGCVVTIVPIAWVASQALDVLDRLTR